MNIKHRNYLSIIFPMKTDHDQLKKLSVHDRIKYRYSVLKGRDSFNKDHYSANEKAAYRDHCSDWNVPTSI